MTAPTTEPCASVRCSDGFAIELHRVRADRWRGIVRLPAKGRWQLVVPNWSDVGYAIPPPLVRFIVVR
jgi:hypothetical protein